MIAHVAIPNAICYVFGAIRFCSALAPRLLGIDLTAEPLFSAVPSARWSPVSSP